MEQSGGIAGTVSAPTRTEESKLRNGKTVEQSGKKEAFHMHHGKPQCRGGCVPGMLLPAYGVEIWKRRRMITHITSRTPRFHASGGPSPLTVQAADCCDELIANLLLCFAALEPSPTKPQNDDRACYHLVDIFESIWREIALEGSCSANGRASQPRKTPQNHGLDEIFSTGKGPQRFAGRRIPPHSCTSAVSRPRSTRPA
jgi:hypothetical protein